MNRTIEMILRNLRSEITRIEKELERVTVDRDRWKKDALKRRERGEIDDMTGYRALDVKPCECGWEPEPGVAIKYSTVNGRIIYQCPLCGKGLIPYATTTES